jgi:aryl-alcohol dehydrogenase-like predicted oxidoreductase
MARYVDDCLKKLDTTYVDVFHLHGVTPAQYPHARDVMVPELKRQQAAGKLRFLAISEQFGGDTGHVMFRQCLADDLFDVVMVGFNILNPSARRRVFPVTREKHVGTLIMFAVREALSRPDELKKVVGQLIERGEVDAGAVDAADPLGFLGDARAVVEDAYRFCRHEPGADVILTGTGDPEHLKANVAAIQQPPLPPEILTRLDAIFGRVDSVSGN